MQRKEKEIMYMIDQTEGTIEKRKLWPFKEDAVNRRQQQSRDKQIKENKKKRARKNTEKRWKR